MAEKTLVQPEKDVNEGGRLIGHVVSVAEKHRVIQDPPPGDLLHFLEQGATP